MSLKKHNPYFIKNTRSLTLLTATLITFGSLAGGANAAVIISVTQNGPAVYMFYAGTLNLSDLTYNATNVDGNTGVAAALSFIELGRFDVSVDYYGGTFTGDEVFGKSSFKRASFATGDHFTFYGLGSEFRVPAGYVSGSPLSGDATYANETITSLGLTEGSYKYQWGNGVNQDSVTINIAVVPESSSCLLVGLGALGFIARRRRTT